MKAIQIEKERQMAVVDIPTQEMKPNEVLLRLEYVGFCGSDLSTYLGKNPMVKMPVIPGHEVGAVIEKVGADVPEILKPGMVVTCNPYTNCGKCASCRNNRVNACQHNETLGVQRNGAMREFIALPWEKVIPAGELDPRTCALIEPMSVGFHAVNRAQVTDIDTVVVIGCGMVGMGAIVRSALRGATVIAADIDDEKLALAKEMGATYAVNTMTDGHSRCGLSRSRARLLLFIVRLGRTGLGRGYGGKHDSERHNSGANDYTVALDSSRQRFSHLRQHCKKPQKAILFWSFFTIISHFNVTAD